MPVGQNLQSRETKRLAGIQILMICRDLRRNTSSLTMSSLNSKTGNPKSILNPRFDNISNTKSRIDKLNFRENMGLLGLDGGFFLADRIFQLLDKDRDGLVKFISPQVTLDRFG